MSLHGHLSRTAVASSLKRPTWERRAALSPFAVLLRMGFTWLLLLPEGRWSLAPPFHPYLHAGGIFLLHCPWSCLRRPLTGILPCEARTFLPHFLSEKCASGHVICLSLILKQEQKSCQESVPIRFFNAMHHIIW